MTFSRPVINQSACGIYLSHIIRDCLFLWVCVNVSNLGAYCSLIVRESLVKCVRQRRFLFFYSGIRTPSNNHWDSRTRSILGEYFRRKIPQKENKSSAEKSFICWASPGNTMSWRLRLHDKGSWTEYSVVQLKIFAFRVVWWVASNNRLAIILRNLIQYIPYASHSRELCKTLLYLWKVFISTILYAHAFSALPLTIRKKLSPVGAWTCVSRESSCRSWSLLCFEVFSPSTPVFLPLKSTH